MKFAKPVKAQEQNLTLKSYAVESAKEQVLKRRITVKL